MKRRASTRLLYLIVASLLLNSIPTHAADPDPLPPSPVPAGQLLTVEDAVRIGLGNHPRIRSAKERIGAQQAVVGQELSAYYPTLSLNNSYRTSRESPDRATDRIASQANVSMTLFNFGKREGSVQSARDTLDATRFSYLTTEEDVILGVKQAYYGYLQTRALVKVREDTLRDRELLVRQAQGFFEVGTRAKIDVARAESNLYSAQADLIGAQNGLRIAWANLKNTMGSPDFPEMAVAEDMMMITPPMSLESAKETAYSSRTELKDFEAQRRAQDQQIATARRGHLPDVLFSANYGRQGNSPADPGDPRTFPLKPAWQVQVSLNVPIFDGFRTTYRVEEALRNYHSIRAQEEERRQLVNLEVEQSYLRLGEVRERIKATEAAERAARENLELANGRYQVGVGSIIEVTDAQTLYSDAQTRNIQSIYDYKIAEAELTRATGRQ